MTFGEFGKTVNYKGENSISVEELLNKKVVMELNSLGGVEKKFFCEFVLTYIYKMKKAKQNQPNQNFDHAIIVDEAHNIFLKKPTNFTNESTTDMIYREMREYGTSLICLDQHISKISDTVKGNSACHIAFQQQLPQDIYDISEIMSLRENKHYFSTLQVGTAIVKLAERYTQPFLIEVPYVETRTKDVTNEDIKARMQAMTMNQEYEKEIEPEFNEAIESPEPVETETIQVEPEIIETPQVIETPASNLTEVQQTLHDFITDHIKAGTELKDIENILEKSKTQGNYTSSDIMTAVNEAFENQMTTTFKKDDVTKKGVHSDLNTDEQVFMEFLQKNPEHTLSTTEVYKQIGLSARKGTNAKKNLEKKGLIKIQEVKYNKGWKKLIRLSN
jgi:hypothetical protein